MLSLFDTMALSLEGSTHILRSNTEYNMLESQIQAASVSVGPVFEHLLKLSLLIDNYGEKGEFLKAKELVNIASGEFTLGDGTVLPAWKGHFISGLMWSMC